MKKIRWGIIGPGTIASVFAKALNSLDNTEINAVASRNYEKAKAFAERFHAVKAYGSYEELVKDPEVDVVYIATPHTEHMANTELCINHGKSVLCEKPFTLNSRQASYLIALAKEKKVFLMEAMWTKYLPVIKEVKQLIKDKRIGELKYFRANFGFQSVFDPKSRTFNPELAGGALLDLGVYPISFVIYMMDRLPDRIVSNAYLGKTNVDEMNSISFFYKEGVMAELNSAVNANTGADAIIIGDKGKIIIPYFYKAEKADIYDLNDNLIDSISMPFVANGYEYEADEVNRCLREGLKESPLHSLQDTLDILNIMDDLRTSWGLEYPGE